MKTADFGETLAAIGDAVGQSKKADQLAGKPHIVLPSGEVTISQTAKELFTLIAPTQSCFVRGGTVVIPEKDKHGEIFLRPLKPSVARSWFERHATFFAWRVGRGAELVLKPTTIPEEMARALLDSPTAKELLPEIRGLVNCPVLVQCDEKIEVLGQGYHAGTGLLITGKSASEDVELPRAVAALKELLSEFDFQTPGDRSRAIASLITPALKMGEHLKGSVPIDMAEADQSQSGKTYRQKIIAAVYNETVALVTSRSGGVGSMDETLNAKLVEGRPFIQFDNLRGRLDSPHLEALLTAEKSFGARVPHCGEMRIDPSRFFILMTSNGVETTRDLANRSNIVRIRKKVGHSFRQYPEGDLLSHVRSKHGFYLGCIFSVVREWLKSGMPRTKEHRHDFTEWCQSLDWILQNIFGEAPLMDGHAKAQERVSNPGLTLLRNLAIVLDQGNELDKPLTAAQLFDQAEVASIEIPGLKESDENKAARKIGSLLAPIFKVSNLITVEGYIVERKEMLKHGEKGQYSSKTYSFSKELPKQLGFDFPGNKASKATQ